MQTAMVMLGAGLLLAIGAILAMLADEWLAEREVRKARKAHEARKRLARPNENEREYRAHRARSLY